MPQTVIPEEQYPSRVSAEFTDEVQAGRTAKSLTEKSGFTQEQVTVIKPDDEDLEHKVEPETRAIGAKVATVHARWVVFGFLVGLAAAWLAVHLGPPLTRSSPLLTYLALVLICPMLGFFLGSIISFRPDHDHVINRARSAAGSGRWTVVVHCADHAEKQRARHALDRAVQVP